MRLLMPFQTTLRIRQVPKANTKRRIGPLDTIGGVATEMRRVYRLAATYQIKTEEASRLIYMLTQMRATLEIATLEGRIDALERK